MSMDERNLTAGIPDAYDRDRAARLALLNSPSLYERTGDINDVNTLLVNRAELRSALGVALPQPGQESDRG